MRTYRWCEWGAFSVLAALASCGAPPAIDYPNVIRTPEGRPIVLENISAIVDDPDLSDDEKREALRELGIEDEELIDAFLTS
jgi:hypothetical protein